MTDAFASAFACTPILLLTVLVTALSSSVEAVRPLSWILAPPSPTLLPRRSLDLDLELSLSNPHEGKPWSQAIPNADPSFAHLDPIPKVLCSGTDYVNECILSILPLLRERRSGHIEPIDILRLEVRSLIGKASVTLAYVKQTLADPSTPEDMSELLHSCAENYDSLIDDLKEASDIIESGNLGSLDSVLNATITDVATCSDAFAESTHLNIDSPTAYQDEYIKKLCDNVLALAQLIQT